MRRQGGLEVGGRGRCGRSDGDIGGHRSAGAEGVGHPVDGDSLPVGRLPGEQQGLEVAGGGHEVGAAPAGPQGDRPGGGVDGGSQERRRARRKNEAMQEVQAVDRRPGEHEHRTERRAVGLTTVHDDGTAVLPLHPGGVGDAGRRRQGGLGHRLVGPVEVVVGRGTGVQDGVAGDGGVQLVVAARQDVAHVVVHDGELDQLQRPTHIGTGARGVVDVDALLVGDHLGVVDRAVLSGKVDAGDEVVGPAPGQEQCSVAPSGRDALGSRPGGVLGVVDVREHPSLRGHLSGEASGGGHQHLGAHRR